MRDRRAFVGQTLVCPRKSALQRVCGGSIGHPAQFAPAPQPTAANPPPPDSCRHASTVDASAQACARQGHAFDRPPIREGRDAVCISESKTPHTIKRRKYPRQRKALFNDHVFTKTEVQPCRVSCSTCTCKRQKPRRKRPGNAVPTPPGVGRCNQSYASQKSRFDRKTITIGARREFMTRVPLALTYLALTQQPKKAAEETIRGRSGLAPELTFLRLQGRTARLRRNYSPANPNRPSAVTNRRI